MPQASQRVYGRPVVRAQGPPPVGRAPGRRGGWIDGVIPAPMIRALARRGVTGPAPSGHSLVARFLVDAPLDAGAAGPGAGRAAGLPASSSACFRRASTLLSMFIRTTGSATLDSSFPAMPPGNSYSM